MLNQAWELEHKQIAREAARKAKRETERKMLMEMKREGISETAIIKVAQSENIPEEVKKLLNDQE